MENILKSKKKFVILSIILFAALFALMAAFTFFDLEISRALFNGGSFFGKLFACIGELPSYLIAPFFLTCAFHKLQQRAPSIFCAALLPFAHYFWLSRILKLLNLVPVYYWLLISAASIMLTAVLLLIFKLMPQDALNKLFYVFLAGALFAAANNLAVQLLKLVWGRVRFINLNGNFTPWYKPNGPNGNYSFPSGHTAGAFVIFTLVFLARAFDLKKLPSTVLTVFSIFFVLCTALSRVILGAHFATDVTFSIIISCALFLPALWLFEKKVCPRLAVVLH